MKGIILAASLCLAAANALAQAPSPSPSRWSLDGGYSQRFWESSANDPQEQREYQERARNGWNLGGDVSVFPLGGRYGVGLTYARFRRALSDSSVLFPDGIPGSMKDVYTIHYAAPSVFARVPLPAAFEVVGQAGVGWMYYRNQHEARDYPGVIEGVALGMHAAVSVDYRPLPFVGVGIGARFLHGDLDALDYNGMRTPFPAVSLTRLDLFAGVRFYP